MATEFDYQLPPAPPSARATPPAPTGPGVLDLVQPQPAPTGDGTPILPLVVADLTERAEHGKRKYGTELRAHNGRDALQDALEEAYDQVMYLRQAKQEWPALVAKVRSAALEEAIQLAELQLQAEPAPGAVADELGRMASYSNGTVRRIVAGLRGLQGKPPAAPEPARMRKPHRWKVLPTQNGTPKRWGCRDCPVERWSDRGPRGGPVHVFEAGGAELARGAPHTVRVPLCPPAPKGAP